MKLSLFFLAILCSHFAHISCSKQLFSLIEKKSKEHSQNKGSIFGSYLQKVEKKIKKAHPTKETSNSKHNKKSAEEENEKGKNKKTGRKLFSHLNKKAKVENLKATHSTPKKNHSHKEHSKKKAHKEKEKESKDNDQNNSGLHEQISFLQQQMKKYIKINKKLIHHIKKNERHSVHHSRHNKRDDDAEDEEEDDD